MKRCSKQFSLICILFTAIILCGGAIRVKASEFETKKTEVSDIVIADYESTLEVGETLTLSVTVLPSEADEQTVYYHSSDENIATVSQTGEVKGITAGKANIQLSAGAVKKEIEINVKTSAKGIKIEKNYIVLKPNQTQQINAVIFPENATERVLSYSSSNTSVATVSDKGLIKAVDCGSASIIVKSMDVISTITVIVNKTSENSDNIIVDELQTMQTDIPKTVSVADCPLVTEEMLEQLYKSKATLEIIGNDYSLQINGVEIKNIENTLNTDIRLVKEKDNLYFTLNEKENLCGNIKISIENAENYKYLYLYNETQGKYRLIKNSNLKDLDLNSNGKYMLTNSKVIYSRFPWAVIIIVSTILLVLSIIYIIFKRRYWFW